MAEKKKSLADQAYEIIKNNIMNLTYPPGMPLTEALLTEELGMSRNPVRTALKMLQSEGLIVTDYYKSMTVKEITDKDINELYQLRELLEGSAFKLILKVEKRKNIPIELKKKWYICVRLLPMFTSGSLLIRRCIWKSSAFSIMTGSPNSMNPIYQSW